MRIRTGAPVRLEGSTWFRGLSASSTSAPAALRWAPTRSQQESALGRAHTHAGARTRLTQHGIRGRVRVHTQRCFLGNVTDQNDPRDAPIENNTRAYTRTDDPPLPPSAAACHLIKYRNSLEHRR